MIDNVFILTFFTGQENTAIYTTEGRALDALSEVLRNAQTEAPTPEMKFVRFGNTLHIPNLTDSWIRHIYIVKQELNPGNPHGWSTNYTVSEQE